MLEQFLRHEKVEELTGLSRSAIYAGMQSGRFPKTIRIGKAAVAWRASDIAAWQTARIAEAHGKSGN